MSDSTLDPAQTEDTDQGATKDAASSDASNDQQNSPSDTDAAAEIEKWKGLARKHEDRAKANASAAKELDRLRQSSMTDQEKAVEDARKAALAEATRTFGTRLVDAEVRAATAGRDLNVEALLEGLDRSRFLTEDGEPDIEAIKKWIDKIAPVTRKQADLGQGRRGTNSPKSKADELSDFFDANFS